MHLNTLCDEIRRYHVTCETSSAFAVCVYAKLWKSRDYAVQLAIIEVRYSLFSIWHKKEPVLHTPVCQFPPYATVSCVAWSYWHIWLSPFSRKVFFILRTDCLQNRQVELFKTLNLTENYLYIWYCLKGITLLSKSKTKEIIAVVTKQNLSAIWNFISFNSFLAILD